MSTVQISKFIVQIIAGSVVCAVGFHTNSETVVIGSMLISPIGAYIIDLGKKLSGNEGGSKGGVLATEMIAMILGPILVGFCAGLVPKSPHVDAESAAKGRLLHMDGWSIGAATLVVAAAGMCFAWDKSGAQAYGIGIATALLPPLVAVGYAIGRGITRTDDVPEETRVQIKDAWKPLVLFLINFLVLLASVVGFRVLSSVTKKSEGRGTSTQSQIPLSTIPTK